MRDPTSGKELGSIEAPASMDHWEHFIDFVTERIQYIIIDESRAYKLKLAYEELISNIIGAADANKTVADNDAMLSVSLMLRSEEGEPWLVLRTIDTGVHFNPNFNQGTRIDTNQPIHERGIGGLGIFLIEQSVDRVSYDWINGTNVYELCMALLPPAKSSPCSHDH